jgi:hypothetical protein
VSKALIYSPQQIHLSLITDLSGSRSKWPGTCSTPGSIHHIMGTWTSDTMATGAVATTASTVLLAVLSKQENGNAASAINAVSHMLWGEEATTNDQLDARHTLAGAGLNGAAMVAWAGMHELMLPRNKKPSVGRALLAGATTSGFAYWVDYHVVPKRFTPGFEERLSRKSLLGIYVALAVSLAVGSLWRRGRR